MTSVACVEAWLSSDRARDPSPEDLADYVIARAASAFPETEREPAGTPPRHAYLYRAVIALANMVKK